MFLLLLVAVLVVAIIAIVRAVKRGQTQWALAIGLTLIVFPVSLVLAIIYLAKSGVDPTLPSPLAAPGWYADPSGRNEFRYWDGGAWTENVIAAGVEAVDPPSP